MALNSVYYSNNTNEMVHVAENEDCIFIFAFNDNDLFLCAEWYASNFILDNGFEYICPLD